MRAAPPRAVRPAQRGQAVVEFAFIVPMMFLLIVGIVYFAMGFNLQQVLNQAAYEGARTWAKLPGGGYRECTPPACDPTLAERSNNFDQYVVPAVRAYVANQGFDGSKVIFFNDDADRRNEALNRLDGDREKVVLTILYPYDLPIGNFAHGYLRVKVSATCALKRG